MNENERKFVRIGPLNDEMHLFIETGINPPLRIDTYRV